jgi:hypothetical protein
LQSSNSSQISRKDRPGPSIDDGKPVIGNVE